MDPKLSIGENRYMYLISLALSQHADLKEVLATFYYIDTREVYVTECPLIRGVGRGGGVGGVGRPPLFEGKFYTFPI